jgi:acetyl esterase/lipase
MRHILDCIRQLDPLKSHSKMFPRPLRFAAYSILLALAFAPANALVATPSGVKVDADLPYKSGAQLTPYEQQRCKLDLYLPAHSQGFPTVIFFHGGNLTGGDKKSARTVAESFAGSGIGFVSAEYRLSPTVTYPAYVQDSAAAVAWVHAHIGEYGGDPNKLFISGHSAGAYLALMLGLDGQFLHDAGVDPSAIAGVIPISGQTVTHVTVRAERGFPKNRVVVDDAAPLYYCNMRTPPMLILYADHDAPARAEENALLVTDLKLAGNKNITGLQMTDRTHGTIFSSLAEENDPGRVAIVTFIAAHSTSGSTGIPSQAAAR